jgi:type I restriction enzyme S subunit
MSSNEWNYLTASTYCSKVTDGTHDSPKRQENGKHLITSKHIKERNIDFKSAYFISIEDFNKINLRSKVEQWDVLISMIGEYCGFCYVERNANIDYAVKNVGIFKTGSKSKAEWLYYYLNSPLGKNSLASLKTGTSQPYISLGALRDLQILVPKNNLVLNKIVSILSSIDEKIENNIQTNLILESIASTLFKEWFTNFNYPNADERRKHSAFGEIPSAWNIGTLGDIYKTTSGGTPSRAKPEYYENGTIGWVKSKELNNTFIIETEEKITEDALKNSSAKNLPIHSVLIAMYGATVGEIGITTKEFTCNQAICSFLPNTNYPFSFIYNFLMQNKQDIISQAVGSAQQNISQQLLLQYKLVIPPPELVQEFHKIVFPLYQKIHDNIEEDETLRELRDNLLPKLMSGQIDIKLSNA